MNQTTLSPPRPAATPWWRRSSTRTCTLACSALAVSLAGRMATGQELSPPLPTVEVVDGTLAVGGAPVRLDPAPPAALPEVRPVAHDARLVALHLRWSTSDLPDAADAHVLVGLDSDGAVTFTTRWESVQPVRVVAADLDGDGEAELIRDRDAAGPCGLDAWWSPEVFAGVARGFQAVSIRPVVPASAVTSGAVAATPDAVPVAEPFAWSTGAPDRADALVDGDPTTGWTEAAPGGGVGQWIAARVPRGLAVRGLRLAAASGGQPVRVLIRTDAGDAYLAAFDDAYREARFDGAGGCAVVTVLDTGGRASIRLAELSLVTDADRIPPDDRAREVWPVAVATACEAGDPASATRLATRALADGMPQAANTIAAIDDPCVGRALAAALAGVASPHRTVGIAAAETTSDVVRSQLLGTVAGPDAASAVLSEIALGARGDTWVQALERLAPELTPDAWTDVATVLAASASDDALRPVSSRLAAAWAGAPWAGPDMLPREDSAAIWFLRLANGMPAGAFAPDPALLREAMGRDNGSVARLAVRAAGHHRLTTLAPDVAEMIRDDSPHLRAAAVVAADLLGVLEAQADRVAGDPDPTVRLAFAGTQMAESRAASAPEEAVEGLAREAWSEVRRAWIAVLVDAGTGSADAALADALGSMPDDVPFALRRWSARGTQVPGAVFALARAGGASPDTLPWALALLPLADGACEDLGWLGELRDDENVPPDVRGAIEQAVGYCGP